MTGEEALALSKAYTKSVALGAGAVQIPGPPGSNIELQNNGTHIQWRVLGASAWNNLIALSELEGGKGETPQFQILGNTLQYKFPSQSAWTDLFAFPDADGVDSITNNEIQDILNNL